MGLCGHVQYKEVEGYPEQNPPKIVWRRHIKYANTHRYTFQNLEWRTRWRSAKLDQWTRERNPIIAELNSYDTIMPYFSRAQSRYCIHMSQDQWIYEWRISVLHQDGYIAPGKPGSPQWPIPFRLHIIFQQTIFTWHDGFEILIRLDSEISVRSGLDFELCNSDRASS
jgi:hypothetical protein